MVGLRSLLSLFLALAMLAPSGAAALDIVPDRDLAGKMALPRRAAGEIRPLTVRGKGDRLTIWYRATEPVELDIAPLRTADEAEFSDVTYATLPPGEEVRADLDLTASPGWAPWERDYHLSFFVPEGGSLAIEGMQFRSASLGVIALAALRGLGERETWQVSIVHVVRGAKVAGVPRTVLFGLLALAGAGAAYAVRRERRVTLATLAVGALAVQALFGAELLRFTLAHASAWLRDGTYAANGSAEEIAEMIVAEASASPRPVLLSVCTDSTNYLPKVLRHLLYPIPVSWEEEDIPRATHLLVAGSPAWSFDGRTLACGGASGAARKIREFPNGAMLFVPLP